MAVFQEEKKTPRATRSDKISLFPKKTMPAVHLRAAVQTFNGSGHRSSSRRSQLRTYSVVGGVGYHPVVSDGSTIAASGSFDLFAPFIRPKDFILKVSRAGLHVMDGTLLPILCVSC